MPHWFPVPDLFVPAFHAALIACLGAIASCKRSLLYTRF
jgi:hypothetical protein